MYNSENVMLMLNWTLYESVFCQKKKKILKNVLLMTLAVYA